MLHSVQLSIQINKPYLECSGIEGAMPHQIQGKVLANSHNVDQGPKVKELQETVHVLKETCFILS